VHDDDELYRRALGGLAGPPIDPYAALRELEPRLNGAHRRRVVTMSASLAAVAAAVTLAVGVAVATRHQEPSVKVVAPASDGSAHIESSTPTVAGVVSSLTSATAAAPATTAERNPSVSSEAGVEETVEGADGGAASSAAGRGGEVGGGNGGPPASNGPAKGAPGTAGPGGGTGSVVTPASTAPGGSDAPVPTNAPTTPAANVAPVRTVSSRGGTVSYRFNGSSITDVQLAPAPGWVGSFDRRESDRVEVVFRQDDHNATISLRVKDGRVEVSTDGES